METHEPNKSFEKLDFESLMTALAGVLHLTRESLVDAFDNSRFTEDYSGAKIGGQGLHFRHGIWSFRPEFDEEGLLSIISTDGLKYRVGATDVEQLRRINVTHDPSGYPMRRSAGLRGIHLLLVSCAPSPRVTKVPSEETTVPDGWGVGSPS